LILGARTKRLVIAIADRVYGTVGPTGLPIEHNAEAFRRPEANAGSQRVQLIRLSGGQPVGNTVEHRLADGTDFTVRKLVSGKETEPAASAVIRICGGCKRPNTEELELKRSELQARVVQLTICAVPIHSSVVVRRVVD